MARSRWVRHGLAALLLLCLPACASLVVPLASSEPFRVYGGVRFSARQLTSTPMPGGQQTVVSGLFRTVGIPLLVLDLPLSLVMDTALLPFTGLAALIEAIDRKAHEPEPRPPSPTPPTVSTFARGLKHGGEPTVLVLDTSPSMHEPRTVRDPLPDGPPAPTDGLTTGALELAACVDQLFDGTLFDVVTPGAVWSNELRVATDATRREAIAWLASVSDVTSQLSPGTRAVVADPRVQSVVVARAPTSQPLVDDLTAAAPTARVQVGVVGRWAGSSVHERLAWDRFVWLLPWRPRGRPLARIRLEDLYEQPRPPTLPAKLGPAGPSTVFVVDLWQIRDTDDFGKQVAGKVRRELAACLAALPAHARVDLVWGDDVCSLPPGGEVGDAISWVWSSDRKAEGPGAAARASALAPGVDRVVVLALAGGDERLARMEAFLEALEAAPVHSVVLVTLHPEPPLAIATRAGWTVHPLY